MEMNDDYAIPSSSPIFDDDFKILLSKDEKLSKINIKDIKIEKSKINIRDWTKMNKNNNAIAYSFGYSSDDTIEIELAIDVNNFDLSKLVLHVVDENNFFEEIGAYVIGLEYDNEWLDMDTEDIDGDYFNSGFFKP